MQALLLPFLLSCTSAMYTPYGLYGMYLTPTLDKASVEGRYLYKPSMYDGAKAVMKHYGVDDDMLKGLMETDMFMNVKVGDDGMVTVDYNFGEMEESVSFTPGKEFDLTNNINSKAGKAVGTILSPNSFVLSWKGEDEMETSVFSLSGYGGTVSKTIYPKMSYPLSSVQMMQKVDEEGKPVAVTLPVYPSVYWG